MCWLRRLGGAALLLAIMPALTLSQIRLEQQQQSQARVSGETRFYYLFENERFTTPIVEVEFNEQGRGKFRFVRKESDGIVNDLQITQSLVNEVKSLFDELNFLDSNEDYQYKKDFSHLGKILIRMTRQGKERTVTFNYTSNPAMNRLVDIFRNIATQETRVFEIETIRSNDPISTPAQLRLLEMELRSKHIAEPRRLVSLLEEIKTDESVPLIARNHAERLIEMINKGK